MKKRWYTTPLRLVAAAVCAVMTSCAVFASADSTASPVNGSDIPSATSSAGSANSGSNNVVKTSNQIKPQDETSAPQIGPQATCRATNWANWGTPYAGATGVSGQDRSIVRWQITSDCVLHLTGGTSPDIQNRASSIPWNSRRGSIVGIKVEGNLTLFKSNIDLNPMFTDMYSLTSVDTTGGSLHLAESAAAGLFDSCTSLSSIKGITGWDTSQATGMASMFYFCTGLTQLDLSGFNTANVEDMSDMFNGANALTSIRFSGNFTTGNVTSMSSMFNGCSLLASLDLSKFDTHSVKSMARMFAGCSTLTSLDLSKFNTASVNNMNAMFQSCNALTSVNLSSFNTSKVTDMSYMFNDCSSLTSWIQPNFTTPLVTTTDYMFDGCTNLATLDISGFDTSQTTSMTNLLPSGMRRLKLGANTKLIRTALSNVDSSINWEEMSSLNDNASHIGHIGNLDALETRVTSSNPAGSYWDARLMSTSVQLSVDANGGNTSFTPVSYDTTTAAVTITVPRGNVLTANKPQYVFTGWNTCAGGGTTGGCQAYQPNDTITVAQGDSNPVRTITLYAQWTKVPAPIIDNNSPIVHAPLGASPTADIIVSNTAAGTDSFVANALANSTTTITTPLGYNKAETGTGTWTETGIPIASIQPVMGRTYAIKALTTMTDPLTGNTVTAGPVSKNGMMAYYNITFDANGGTGAPADMSGFADVDDHYLTTSPIPANVIPTKGEHDMFAGWATSPTATQPDPAYNPGNHAPTFWQYDSSHPTAKTLTLYAVWHEAKAPVISEVHRDPTNHHVIATGTAQPWNVIGPPTVGGSSSRGLKVDAATLTSDGTLSIAGTASGTGTSSGGQVVTVRIRACSTNTTGPNGTAPPAKTGWSNDNNDIPAGCTQVFGMPTSYIQVPSFPSWLGGLNNVWSANLNVTGKPYIWVYTQYQSGAIDGPLTVTPLTQGSDNSVKTCVKPMGAAAGSYVCGTATVDNTAAFDGTTAHNWSLDLPESITFNNADSYDTSSHLYIDDVWRNNASGGGGTQLSVISPEAFLGGAPTSVTSLPFTGGLFRRIAVAVAALIGAAAILLAAFVTFRRYVLSLRNR